MNDDAGDNGRVEQNPADAGEVKKPSEFFPRQ